MHSRPPHLGRSVRTAAVALCALLAPALTSSARAAAGCDAGDLEGTFSFVVHGTNPAGEPFGAIGTLVADGAGNIEGFRIAVDNGVYGTAAFSCTYAMSPQCLFRGPCVDDGEALPEVQLDGALADNGREILLVMSGIPAGAGGPVVTGKARQQ
ncbi:MAG: hypothetical protein NDJ75_03205 [Thermoanaerobaculia bacterium]|nr:hypothetical protein [Thermoanaerobaculia bacterium]